MLWPALYFSRQAIPWGLGPRWHHVGIYAYRRAVLDRYVSLPPSPLEQREQLDAQHRAQLTRGYGDFRHVQHHGRFDLS